MTERRQEPRQRSLLGATIAFGRRQCVMDCVVRNISAGGAMLAFPHSAFTPRQFALHIPHRQEACAATVVWRRHDRIGVTLSSAEALDAADR